MRSVPRLLAARRTRSGASGARKACVSSGGDFRSGEQGRGARTRCRSADVDDGLVRDGRKQVDGCQPAQELPVVAQSRCGRAHDVADGAVGRESVARVCIAAHVPQPVRPQHEEGSDQRARDPSTRQRRTVHTTTDTAAWTGPQDRGDALHGARALAPSMRRR
jgi:hypothetical protein